MKKQLVLVAFVLLFLLPGCAEDTMRTWVWGDGEVVGARVGSMITENNEAGIMLEKQMEDCESVIGGIYAVRYFPAAKFRNPFIMESLPATIEGRPYIGGKLDIDLEANNSIVSPVIGTVFEDVFFVEYQLRAYEPGTTTADGLFRFGLWFKY